MALVLSVDWATLLGLFLLGNCLACFPIGQLLGLLLLVNCLPCFLHYRTCPPPPAQSFFVADGKVWVRNYQIVDKGDGSTTALNRKIEATATTAAGGGEEGTGTDDPLSLVEMGPRFVLNPIRVFAGSFGGPTLYNNAAYVSPNDVRSAKKRKAGTKFEDRQDAKKVIRGKKAEPAVPRGPLDDVFSG